MDSGQKPPPFFGGQVIQIDENEGLEGNCAEMKDSHIKGASRAAIEECREMLGIRRSSVQEDRLARFVLPNDTGVYEAGRSNVGITFRYNRSGMTPHWLEASLDEMKGFGVGKGYFSPSKEIFLFDRERLTLVIKGDGFDFGLNFSRM